MKGIAHFISGVAATSFCPWAIEAAQNGNPAFFILGAAAGVLPDTIDFKFYRFFYRHDIAVELTSTKLDPQPVADAVALAVAEAAATGRPVRLKLATIKIGADNWRQYRVRIDAGEVRVQFGPIVSTGQAPQSGTLPANRPVAVAKLAAPVKQNYEPVYTIDIFDGPSFLFKRTGTGEVEIDFLPWHRNWSHSFTFAALLAGVASCWTWKSGAVVFAAYAVHVIQDHFGHMGSNLFFPFTKQRTPGLKRMHSGDAFPNFTTVWLCCLLIFWNVYAAIPAPIYHFSFIRFMAYALVIPFAGFGVVRWWLTRGTEREDSLVTWDL